MSGGVGADRKRSRKATAPARYPIPGGVRHTGGASLVQAPTWNVGKRRDKPPGCSEGRSRTVKVGEPYRPRAMGGLS